jgi:hypothetical protein
MDADVVIPSLAAGKPAGHPKPRKRTREEIFAARKLEGRSRLSNGKDTLPGIDGRSLWVRRCRDLIEDHANCYGGEEHLSVPRMSLLRRQSAQLVQCEILEAKMATNEATFEDIDQHNRLVGTPCTD